MQSRLLDTEQAQDQKKRLVQERIARSDEANQFLRNVADASAAGATPVLFCDGQYSCFKVDSAGGVWWYCAHFNRKVLATSLGWTFRFYPWSNDISLLEHLKKWISTGRQRDLPPLDVFREWLTISSRGYRIESDLAICLREQFLARVRAM